MNLSRNEAIVFASFLKLLHLSSVEKRAILEELDNDSIKMMGENVALRKYLENEFSYYTNNYIQLFLNEILNSFIEINDIDIQLSPCPCCGYNTIKQIGHYNICPVCYWEDDGGRDENAFSSANSMTLKEAKFNFQNLGVMSERFLEIVEKDRMLKYKRLL